MYICIFKLDMIHKYNLFYMQYIWITNHDLPALNKRNVKNKVSRTWNIFYVFTLPSVCHRRSTLRLNYFTYFMADISTPLSIVLYVI